MMLGFADIYSIEYIRTRSVWAFGCDDGKVTNLQDAKRLKKLSDNYQAIMERCRAFD
ncbi:hypothetical protein NXW41_07525 [Bacteroides thetaiotaomicron]|nr:hypothetical protein [Bacteroides thetaiotaomicron]MCS2998238.1 hypothetical protein [Bacteroides thetaiotaomicron]